MKKDVERKLCKAIFGKYPEDMPLESESEKMMREFDEDLLRLKKADANAKKSSD